MAPKTERQGNEKGYVTYYLTRQQKQDAHELKSEFDDPIEVIERFALDGYYVTINLDFRSGAMRVAVTTYQDGHTNYNLTLTEYNGDLDHALLELWYFHDVVCDDHRWLDFATGFTPSKRRTDNSK